MNKEYYERRLEFAAKLYREGEKMIIAYGEEKIKRLVEEYKRFQQHEASLAGAIQNFVLGDL